MREGRNDSRVLKCRFRAHNGLMLLQHRVLWGELSTSDFLNQEICCCVVCCRVSLALTFLGAVIAICRRNRGTEPQSRQCGWFDDAMPKVILQIASLRCQSIGK